MSEIKLESIGFTRNVINKSLLFKMIYKGRQYLLTKSFHDYYFKLYNNKFEFEVVNFDYRFIREVEDLIRSKNNRIVKKDVLIDINNIENYFNKIVVDIKVKRRVNREFTSDEINSLFEYVSELGIVKISDSHSQMMFDFIYEHENLSYTEKEVKLNYYKTIVKIAMLSILSSNRLEIPTDSGAA